MTRRLSARVERWPVAGAFVIARGAKTYVDVVVAEITDGGLTGRGEATAIYYRGETAEACRDAIVAQTDAIAAGAGRQELLARMPAGAARNALDAALWDIEAKTASSPAWRMAGLEKAPAPLETAFTLSLDTPDGMARAAAKAALRHRLLKLKLAGEGDRERVAAVRAGAPDARLIVDANEAWTDRDVTAEADALVPHGVALIEQPVAAGRDALLDGVRSPIPLCADESCHDRADLDRLVGRYAAINIKLDKAGGLTEALALAEAARARGLALMVGCMLSTSLGIAPAMLVAQGASWVDLDGPLLLGRDRAPAIDFTDGRVHPPTSALWG